MSDCTILHLIHFFGHETWFRMSLSEQMDALIQYIYGEKK